LSADAVPDHRFHAEEPMAESEASRAGRLARKLAYRIRYRDILAAKQRTYIAANSEFVKARKRAIRAADPEKARAQERTRRAANPEKKRARDRAYHAANPLRKIWNHIRDRCTNPRVAAFKHYGGRGIAMCDRWRDDFEAFQADMLPTYRRGLTIERIDNNGPYSPENCRWATKAEQNRNKRNNVLVETPSGPMRMAEAAERYGINHGTLRNRRHRGTPLFAPLRKWPRHGKSSL
jgi:hypothetical protein